jgi:hypothetical protein
MKYALSLVVFISIIIFSSCSKRNDGGEMRGSWKLIEVFDKTTNTFTHPPSGSNIDVVITFLDGNKFAGHTLRNTLTDGSYKQNGNEIVFGNFSMTKIAEDEWGGSFLTVLNSCLLQSVSPCASSVVTIEGNSMKIHTQLRYDIILEKL